MFLCILTLMLLKLEFLASWSRTKTGGWCFPLIFDGRGSSQFKGCLIANRYDKREDLSATSPEMKLYSHLLMEANVTRIELLRDTHQPLAFVEGYSNIAFNPLHFPPLSVRLERKTVLMERKTGTRQSKQ